LILLDSHKPQAKAIVIYRAVIALRKAETLRRESDLSPGRVGETHRNHPNIYRWVAPTLRDLQQA
jgi:hypothetical protein